MTSLLMKTELARLALAPGTRTLSPKERALVLLADGQRTAHELLDIVSGASLELVHGLISRGFLSSAPSASPAPLAPPAPRPGPAAARPKTVAPVAAVEAPPSPPKVRHEIPAPAPARAERRPTRTPAATKLYLMDLSERVFARSDPQQWERLRDLLREVRDEEGLLQAIGQVTRAISQAAGEDRAAAVRRELLDD